MPLFLRLLPIFMELSTSLRTVSRLKLPFDLRPAEILRVPPAETTFDRYCHVDSMSVSRLRVTRNSLLEFADPVDPTFVSLPSETLLYGRCNSDEDCSLSRARPFCLDGVCRECRPGNEFEDCGTSTAICSAESSFTCSECVTDEECKLGTVCRTVFNQEHYLVNRTMTRKTCNKCESVPPFGEVTNPSNCEWRCPINTFYSPETTDSHESCNDCPVCGRGQFYGSSDSPSQFFSTCTNSTNVICSECSSIGIDSMDENFCAQILPPSEIVQDSLFVGDLGDHYPCRFFECKQGWFLDHSLGKCRKCHLTMCAPGETLENCGDNSPGKCVPCPNGRHKPRNGEWIVPNDPLYSIKRPIDTCQFVCAKNFVFDSENNVCVKCDPGADKTDPLACVENVTTYRVD